MQILLTSTLLVLAAARVPLLQCSVMERGEPKTV